MVINTATLQAGEFFQDTEILQLPVAAATVFAKGDVVYLDPADDTWKEAPVDATGDFGVAMEASAATTAAKKIRIAVGGRTTVTADGAIAATNPVMMSGATAGEVIEYVASTASGTYVQAEATAAIAEFQRIVGWYAGKATGSDRDGATIAAAADGDVIIITLRGRGGKY